MRRIIIGTPSQTRVTNLHRDWKRGRLTLNPDYQRSEHVWDNPHRSCLIESVILGLPIPAIFQMLTPDHQVEVIDGIQRCTSLFWFIDNEYGLTQSALRVLPELAGKRFRDLTAEDQDALLEYEVQLQRVPSDTELFGVRIGQEMFRRLNNGIPVNLSESMLSQHPRAKQYMHTLLPDFERLLGANAQQRLSLKQRRSQAYGDIAQALMGLIVERDDSTGALAVGEFQFRHSGNNPSERHLDVVCNRIEASDTDYEQLTQNFQLAAQIIHSLWGDRALQRRRDGLTVRTNRTAIYLQFFAVRYLSRMDWSERRDVILQAWDEVTAQPFLGVDVRKLQELTSRWARRLEAIRLGVEFEPEISQPQIELGLV